MRFICISIIFSMMFFYATPFLSASQEVMLHRQVVSFSEEEMEWIKTHPVVRVAPDPDFPPVEYFDKNGKHQGIAADFLKILSNKLPLQFEIVQLRDWEECISKMKNGEIDMFSAATPTAERIKYLRFTSSFVEFPAVIIVRDDQSCPGGLHKLKEMKVAVVSGYAAHEFMEKKYPEVDLAVVSDIVTGLRLTSFGRVDAMVLNLASASYYIKKQGLSNLQLFEDTGFIYDLSFATRKDWPILTSIIQKGIDSITPQERNTIISRWIVFDNRGVGISKEVVTVGLIIFVSILLVMIFTWNLSLRRLVNLKTMQLRKELEERKKAEKEKETLQAMMLRSKKMEAMGLMAGGVAHDLNNILSGLTGYPELLLIKMDADDPTRKYVEVIKESGERAAAIVEDLLTVARGVASAKKSCNLNEIIHKHLDSAEHQKQKSLFPEITVELTLANDLMPVNCSEIHMKKIVMNLVQNAMEALKISGKIEIRTDNIYLDRQISGYENVVMGEYVLMKVSDTGPGISPEDMDRIFEPFYTKKVMGISGTGLGLAVVWNSVHDHEGYIDIETSPSGTTFCVYIPVSRSAQVEHFKGSAEEIEKGCGESVLVVDDESTQRLIASEMLEMLGYDVIVVSSGEEALKLVQTECFEILLLDMVMPGGISGLKTYEKIIEFCPDQKAVIASGFSETEDVRRAQELGAGRYLKKPYNLTQLAAAVREELLRK